MNLPEGDKDSPGGIKVVGVESAASAGENPCSIIEEADIESLISYHESKMDEPSEVMVLVFVS